MSSADALHRILSRRYPEYSWIVEVRPDADERQRALAARFRLEDARAQAKNTNPARDRNDKAATTDLPDDDRLNEAA